MAFLRGLHVKGDGAVKDRVPTGRANHVVAEDSGVASAIPHVHPTGLTAAALGGLVGLAWATSLRAWMTHLAIEFDTWPVLTWEGTFLAVLMPAVVVGALIGLDFSKRVRSKSLRALVAWSPLLLLVGPALLADDFVGTLMDTGEGGGAIGVVVIGMTGAVCFARRGPVWSRFAAGLVAVGVTGAMAYLFYFAEGISASGTFGAIYLVVLMSWLAVGSSLPMRRYDDLSD